MNTRTKLEKETHNKFLGEKLFNSFFWGGFECAYAKIETKKRIDLLALSKHDKYCKNDYKLIKDIGISTVREGLSWSQIDRKRGKMDFSRFEKMMQEAREENIQQIWDLNHFDYPDYLDIFSREFVERFKDYAVKAVEVIRKYQKDTIFIAPINELSFFCYMSAEAGVWAPYEVLKGDELKKNLIRAAIAAMDAIWSVDNNVRFIQVDPLVYRLPKNPKSKELVDFTKSLYERQFESWDALTGQKWPELGGNPKYLDIIGINYYFNNQEWISGVRDNGTHIFEPMPWDSKSRVSFAEILNNLYKRYKRPIVVTETGSWGNSRTQWWKRTLKEINDAIKSGIPLLGVCVYPIIDRHDWHDMHLTYSGLWDFDNTPELTRIPNNKCISIVKEYISEWG